MGQPIFGASKNIALTGLTLLIIALICRLLPGFLNQIAILPGLLLGTLLAIPFALTNLNRIAKASSFRLALVVHSGLPMFAVGTIISLLIVMLVSILAVGQIINKLANQQTANNHRGADMFSMFASIFNGFLVNAVAQNLRLIAIIGIKSRLRGAVMGQFGTVAPARIRTCSKTDFSGNANLDIVGVSLRMEILPIAMPDFYNRFSERFHVIF